MAISSSSFSAAILCISNSSNISTCPKLPFFSMPSNSAKLHTMTPFKLSSNSRVFAALEVLESQGTNFEDGSGGTSVHSVAAEFDKAIITAREDNQFPPSFWGDRFLSYSENEQERDLYAREVAKLKEIVRLELLSKETSMKAKIILIDNLERLGVAYHFEEEIEDELKQIFHMNQENEAYKDDDELFIVSLHFRLLRQHGYNISSGIFEKFNNPKSGAFKENLKSDTRGILSLYEAAYVRTRGDDILEEALNFTNTHLKSFIEKPNCPILGKQVEHALDQPLHRSTPRLQARQYISIYEELDSKNESLMRLAKLDFNLVQMLHKKELSELSRWWKKLGIITKLHYARDRLVESYCYGVGAFYEPQYSVARIMLTKVVMMVTIIDDTYDAYGTMEELQVFTDAVQKWDVEEIDQLPNYMKICYKALLDLFDNLEEEIKEDNRSYAIDASKEGIKQVVQSYFLEAKWFIAGHPFRFAEYMSNELFSSGLCFLLPVCYLGMKDATKEVFSWLSQNPQIVRPTAALVLRTGDISTYEVEKKRGQIMTSIDCYMMEFGVTKEEAILKFKEMREDGWKDMNKEFVKPNRMPWKFMSPLLNLARLAHMLYRHDEDSYTHPEKVLKYYIASMVVEPVPI